MLVVRKCRKRHRPAIGDVFAFCGEDELWRFGKVIFLAEDLPEEATGDEVFVHVYDTTLPTPEAPDPIGDLVSYHWTDRSSWSRGHFQHVRHEQVDPAEVLVEYLFAGLGGVCTHIGADRDVEAVAIPNAGIAEVEFFLLEVLGAIRSGVPERIRQTPRRG